MKVQDVYQLIDCRAACRAYRTDPIPEEVLSRILEAGCKSPSSGGFQGISIIKVTDPNKRKKLVEFSRGQGFIASAPVSLIFCVDYHRICQVIAQEPAPLRVTDQFAEMMMSIVNAAVCAQTVALAAEAEGLGSCYIGNILNVMDQVSCMLDLPGRVFPVIMLTLGWPKIENRRQAPKYPASLLVHENGYQERTDSEVFSAYRKQNREQEFPAKPEWVDACCAAAEEINGPQYAERIREYIAARGCISPYQYWFGCYYRDEKDFMTTADYFNYFKKQGFGWLEDQKRSRTACIFCDSEKDIVEFQGKNVCAKCMQEIGGLIRG